MQFDFLGDKGGASYWHYVTGKTTYVIVKDDTETYRAFYHRNGGGAIYLRNVGVDSRISPFRSFLEAEKACNAKLRALRGV